MKQSLKHKQKLSLNLTPNLQNQIKLLSHSGFEIRSDLDKLIEEFCKGSDNKKLIYFRDEVRADRYRNAINPNFINDSLEFLLDQEKGLKENLSEQLIISPLEQYETLIGEIIIDSILDNGRLDPELEFKDIKRIIKEDFDIDIDDKKIESILSLIQNFDPPGCGYRSIEELLDIQVNNLEIDTKMQKEIRRSLTSLVNQEIRKENLEPEIKIQIDKLNLHLGDNFGSAKDLYVKPDLIALCQENVWQVSLNDDFIKKEIIEIIKREIESSNKEKVIEAKSFIRGLDRRQQTLFLVGQYILTRQSKYLNECSDKSPITSKEIARALQISESTISRIVSNKYIKLPDKLIPLKELLQKKVNKGAEGNDVTPKELKDYISLFISEENPKQPISDENLRILLLTKYQIKIARRTVAKYREEAGIGSTRVRKIN